MSLFASCRDNFPVWHRANWLPLAVFSGGGLASLLLPDCFLLDADRWFPNLRAAGGGVRAGRVAVCPVLPPGLHRATADRALLPPDGHPPQLRVCVWPQVSHHILIITIYDIMYS